MTLRARHDQLKKGGRASLSPPMWKDQLKQRCMQRLRQDRDALLAKLRSPDATRSVADEMKRLVYNEEQRDAADGRRQYAHTQQQPQPQTSAMRHPVFALQQHGYVDSSESSDDDDALMTPVHHERSNHSTEAYASLEELVADGKLSEDDYLEIVHALEDELLAEMMEGESDEFAHEQELADHMVEFEEASLEAMLASLDLSVPDDFFDDEFVPSDDDSAHHVLCPICKVGTVRETLRASPQSFPQLACVCGFTFELQHEPLHGALEDFQETVAAAFLAHRYVRVGHSVCCSLALVMRMYPRVTIAYASLMRAVSSATQTRASSKSARRRATHFASTAAPARRLSSCHRHIAC